jgi:hypothetical protein
MSVGLDPLRNLVGVRWGSGDFCAGRAIRYALDDHIGAHQRVIETVGNEALLEMLENAAATEMLEYHMATRLSRTEAVRECLAGRRLPRAESHPPTVFMGWAAGNTSSQKMRPLRSGLLENGIFSVTMPPPSAKTG